MIDKHWPSKTPGTTKSGKHAPGAPDVLLMIGGSLKPVGVWENKGRGTDASEALEEARYYIEGLHRALPGIPALPRLAVGCNGEQLLLSYFSNEGLWLSLKVGGAIVQDKFPIAEFLRNGISSQGILTAANGAATTKDLRIALSRLKTLYRLIPPLAPGGRRQTDFTIALLTIRLLVEQNPDWGTWAEQPALKASAPTMEQGIAEILLALADRILSNPDLKERYGNILQFKEKEAGTEVAFDFKETIAEIPRDRQHLTDIFKTIDALPPIIASNFDIFGEVYQYIGDEATKKALGEFFTGRHIISGLLPIFAARTGWDRSFESVKDKRIADIACGTGGFLTETLRLVRRLYEPDTQELKDFAQRSFYGFDLGYTNASRARVNMYFAGDGFSVIKGGVDSLDKRFLTTNVPRGGFDAILTNPPYGKSSYGRAEEAFLARVVDALKSGEGWGLIVLPTGVLENPRSQKTRFSLLKNVRITDVVVLPKHELDDIMSSPLAYPNGTTFISIRLADLFMIQKGDSGLTEEIIYQYFDVEGLPVYGGGASAARFKITRIARTNRNRSVTVFRGPVIIISMDGTSGSMRIIDEGEFCANHHGSVLTPVDLSVDLYWFVQQNEPLLRALASNQKASATLNMTQLQEFMVQIPIPRAIRATVGRLRKELVSIRREFISSDTTMSKPVVAESE